MFQQNKFIKNRIFHICNKSIANFGIFKDPQNVERFIITLHYYNGLEGKISLSKNLRKATREAKTQSLLDQKDRAQIKFLAYCIMPDHYHLLIKVLVDNSLSKYLNDIENSYTRYFNLKFNRKGPLWQSRFRSVLIRTNEQLLHVSRYIHLNPVTDKLVEKPEDWKFSSYRDHVQRKRYLESTLKEISIRSQETYKNFVENNIDYQRRLKIIKKLLLE